MPWHQTVFPFHAQQMQPMCPDLRKGGTPTLGHNNTTTNHNKPKFQTKHCSIHHKLILLHHYNALTQHMLIINGCEGCLGSLFSLVKAMEISRQIAQAYEDGSEELITVLQVALNLYTENGTWKGSDEVSEEERKMDMPAIFTCLNGTSEAVCELAIQLILRVSHAWEPTTLLDTFASELKLGLLHPVAPVRRMTITIIEQASAQSPQAMQLAIDMGLWTAASDLLFDDDPSVAAETHAYLVKSLKSSQSVYDTLMSSDQWTHFRDITSSSSQLVRLWDLYIDFAATSPEAAAATDKLGALKELFQAISSPDILLRLTAIEVMKKCSASPLLLGLIKDNNVHIELLKLTQEAAQDLMLQSCVPVALGTFAELCANPDLHINITALDQEFDFSKLLDSFLARTDAPELQFVTLNTLASIGALQDGLGLLCRSEAICDMLAQASFNSSNELLKTRAMHSIASVLVAPKADTVLCQQLYSKLQKTIADPIPVRLMKLMRLPFEDTVNAAFGFACGLASHSWGRKVLIETGGFYEYLVSRPQLSWETAKAKHLMIEKLIESKEEVLSAEQLMELRRYHRQGMFAPQEQDPDVVVGSKAV
eukprot:m.257477 g.257477  ORF g.257477 m.257477 type:complete len:595 (+) comp15529_c1_seq4:247-2031(+)